MTNERAHCLIFFPSTPEFYKLKSLILFKMKISLLKIKTSLLKIKISIDGLNSKMDLKSQLANHKIKLRNSPRMKYKRIN